MSDILDHTLTILPKEEKWVLSIFKWQCNTQSTMSTGVSRLSGLVGHTGEKSFKKSTLSHNSSNGWSASNK